MRGPEVYRTHESPRSDWGMSPNRHILQILYRLRRRGATAGHELNNAMRRWLDRSGPVVFTTVAGMAGFCAYFAMYAFRKPFSAATFSNVPGWHFALDYKIALVLAQVFGYALSKMIGIKFISELDSARRSLAFVGLILSAWLALLAFAVVPAPWNVAAMFLNGLPLGMIWGLVFGYMEGRRTSEVLGAVVCASFIVSSGAVKTVGKLLMAHLGISPFWMPAATGALFLPVVFLSVWALSSLPPPNAQDEAARVKRAPMDGVARASFIADYGIGIGLLVICYVLATALRDFRDNFAAELWANLGYGNGAAIFTASEIPVAVLALAVLGLIIAVKDNGRALMVIHGVIVAGLALLGGSTLAFQAGWIGPVAWMILTGAGLYMAYTPFNAMLFDRLIAVSGRIGTAGFLIYLADSCGYLGSCALLVWRNFGLPTLPWLEVYIASAYVTSTAGIVLVLFAALYFHRRRRRAVCSALRLGEVV